MIYVEALNWFELKVPQIRPSIAGVPSRRGEVNNDNIKISVCARFLDGLNVKVPLIFSGQGLFRNLGEEIGNFSVPYYQDLVTEIQFSCLQRLPETPAVVTITSFITVIPTPMGGGSDTFPLAHPNS
jgi:hypothetical protein